MRTINLPCSTGITCIFDYEDCTESTWPNRIEGQPNMDAIGTFFHNDYVKFVGNDYSYALLTYGGMPGGNATNSTQCIRYVAFKNLSGVYTSWRTVIGNETGTNFCSTIAMNSSGRIQFTRNDIYSNQNVSDWHILCWTSDSSSEYSTLWIDGIKIGQASGCHGWAADTYLCKGSGWGYDNNDTAFKFFIVGDTIHSDDDIRKNMLYLQAKYFTGWEIKNGQITNENFIPMPELYDTQPDALWRTEDSNLFNKLMPPLPDLFDTLPDALWRTEDNNLFNKLMPQNTYLGAFANATQLRRISIPKSCKKIGRYSFRNTKLTAVTIASDCTYYDTSFPEGCVVNFYPD